MKFMKLGHRPDTFYTADAVRSVSSEISSDLVIHVKGAKFLLHKFPLLSKCGRLQKLCSDATDAETAIRLSEIPGGVEAFEACAKFCYGITITVSAFNIVSFRCAAEYLGMKEQVEKGNLISKLDTFFMSCVLRGWKDTIVCLQSTRAFPVPSQEMGITARCIDAAAIRVAAYPSKLKWSASCSRGGRDDSTPCNSVQSSRHRAGGKGWWGGNIAELGIDHYWRVMVAIKATNKVPANLVGEALQVYARRWLPNMTKNGITIVKQMPADPSSDPTKESVSKHRLILESVVALLPPEKGAASCSFMLKLLKAATFLGTSYSSKMDLARRIGLQLEEATVNDLLIPSLSDADDASLYDVDIVSIILEQFMLQGQTPPTSPLRERLVIRERRRRSRSAENVDVELEERRRSSSASHGARLKVAKLIDGYLQVIAGDEKLPLQKVVALAEAIPDFARPDHDDLYSVIDTYFKAHPDLSKNERKRVCRVLDCKKLSMEACVQAAQNELLPLRVVVQVLFFEQARSAMLGGPVTELPHNLKLLLAAHDGDTASRMGKTSVEDEWSVSGLKSAGLKIPTLRMKLAEADTDIDEDIINQNGLAGKMGKPKFLYSIPATPKKMLSKLRSINRSVSEKH